MIWETGGKGFLLYNGRKLRLCPIIIQKTELVSNEFGYLVVISKQNIEGVTWFLLGCF